MKKLILSFLFLPSLVMGDHCDGGACPALEHFKDTGDEVAKDLLPYLGIGLILAVTMNSGSDQSSLSYINFDSQNLFLIEGTKSRDFGDIKKNSGGDHISNFIEIGRKMWL